jgi:hypothetical protein
MSKYSAKSSCLIANFPQLDPCLQSRMHSGKLSAAGEFNPYLRKRLKVTEQMHKC